MAWLEVTAQEFNWSVPGKNGRVVISYQCGVHEVTRQCLADAVAAKAGKEAKRVPKDG